MGFRSWFRRSRTTAQPANRSEVVEAPSSPGVWQPATTVEEPRDPCGFYHPLMGNFDAPGARVGPEDMTRYAVVRESIDGIEQLHDHSATSRATSSDETGPVLTLKPGTRVRYDQWDFDFAQESGWHRFQVLSGPHRGKCVELSGPDMGDGPSAYIVELPDELDPIDVSDGEWELRVASKPGEVDTLREASRR